MARILPDIAKRPHGQLIDIAGVRCFDERHVNALEEYLHLRFAEWRVLAGSSACTGDWIWNPHVGFAQILDLHGPEKAEVHVRKRAENLIVKLSHYLNLRIFSSHDGQLLNFYKAACA